MRSRTGWCEAGAIGLESLESRSMLSSSFNPDGGVVYRTGEQVSSVVAADLNGDGVQDVVLAAGRTVQFLRGMGNGKFAPARTIATFNAGAGLIGVGKFNSDGLPDLFVVQQTDLPGQRGWTRLLLNQGSGNFAIGPYGRLTNMNAVTLTVANVDTDDRDEVLITGKRLILTAEADPADDVLRIFDPTFNTPPGASPGTLLGMKETITLLGSSMTAPTVIRRTDHGDIYIGMADHLSDADGTLRVYSYEEFPVGIPEMLPPPRLNELARSTLIGRPNSLAIDHIAGNQIIDAAVTTQGLDSALGFAAVFGRTYLLRGLPPGGDVPVTQFGTPTLVHSRVLQGGDLFIPSQDYRITGISDLNSDGLLDIALTVTQGTGPSQTKVEFVELIQLPTLIPFGLGGSAQPTFQGVIGSSQTTTGVTFATAASFAAAHTLADLRALGRSDLILLDRPTANGPIGVKVIQNTTGLKRPRVLSGLVVSADTPIHPGTRGPAGSMWDVHATVQTPESTRFIRVDTVRIYRDSNRNGVLDSADTLLGSAFQDGIAAVATDIDGSSSWTLHITIGVNWGLGPIGLFAVATDSNLLDSAPGSIAQLTVTAN